MVTREQALEILHEHTKSENLRRHALAVEIAMRALSQHFNVPEGEVNKWAIVGLLHDADYEETKDNPTVHGLKTVEWLKEAGVVDQGVLTAIAAHNHSRNGSAPPANKISWSVYCCDELTGFIVAVALVRPDKKLASVTADSVLKKWDEKSFAAGVDRAQIKMCEEKLGIKLSEFIKFTLEAMQAIHKELGL